jgi:ATP-binding cassette subfamily B (MDR/TAP) protein 1
MIFFHFSLQYTSFAISGSKLTQRIRSTAFACLLRQEIAYFDRPENSSGAISVLLSSNASAIQEISGTRLAVICEAFALFVFGLLFGLYLNWHFAIISFVSLFILGVSTYLQARSDSRLKQRSNVVLRHASSVRSGFCYKQI